MWQNKQQQTHTKNKTNKLPKHFNFVHMYSVNFILQIHYSSMQRGKKNVFCLLASLTVYSNFNGSNADMVFYFLHHHLWVRFLGWFLLVKPVYWFAYTWFAHFHVQLICQINPSQCWDFLTCNNFTNVSSVSFLIYRFCFIIFLCIQSCHILQPSCIWMSLSTNTSASLSSPSSSSLLPPQQYGDLQRFSLKTQGKQSQSNFMYRYYFDLFIRFI